MTVNVTIPHLASNITFVGANLCSIFGTIINATALYVILKGRKVKYHNTSPIIFLQALNALIFCSIFLPLEGTVYISGQYSFALVNSIPSWLVGAEIDCAVHAPLPRVYR